jgi:uncharacterized Tic20 family protein
MEDTQMQVVVVCPTCKAKLKIEQSVLGKTIRCPVCSQAVRAQAEAARTAPVPQKRSVDVLEEIPDERIDEVLPAEEEIDDLEPVDDLEEVGPGDRGGRRRSRRKRRRGGSAAEQTTMAMLVHISAIFTGMLVPLIIWLVKKNESRFVDFHGRQCLNFQLSYGVIGGVVLAVLFCFGMGMATEGAMRGNVAGAAGGIWISFLVWGLAGLFVLFMSIMEVMAALNAKEGEWYELPALFRAFGDVDEP